MGYYPTIDYLGAAQGIIRNIDDFERLKIARAAEESNARYRDMQMQNLQDEMQQKKKLREAQSGFPAYLEQNQGMLQPTTSQRVVGTTPDYTTSLGDEDYSVPGTKDVMGSVTTPAQTSMSNLAAKYYMDKGLPEYGLKLMADERAAEEKATGHKMTMATSLLGHAITQGDSEAFNKLMTSFKADKQLAPMFQGVTDMKLNSKKELETTVERPVTEGEMKFPGTDTPVPSGNWKITTVTMKDGNTRVKEIVPGKTDTEDNTDFKLFVKAQKALGKTDMEISKGWGQEIKSRQESGLGGYVKQMDLDRKERDEERKNRE